MTAIVTNARCHAFVTFACLSSTITMTVDESIPMTPSRRSKRFQPLVTPVKTDAFIDKSAVWTDDGPFYIRPTVLEDYQVLQDEGWQPNPQIQTAFRKSFQRNKSTAPVSRKSRRPRAEAVEIETFEVGDTVLVKLSLHGIRALGLLHQCGSFKVVMIGRMMSPTCWSGSIGSSIHRNYPALGQNGNTLR